MAISSLSLEVAVAMPLADPNRSVVDLPSTAAGQRRDAPFCLALLGSEAPGGSGGSSGKEAQCETASVSPGLGQPFNVQTAIAEFLADADKATLKLPPMDAAARREARKLAVQQPELKCESYGLGAERCIHLFKIVAGRSECQSEVTHLSMLTPSNLAAHVFSVKNTYSDGLAAEEALEPGSLCSTPVRLDGGMLPRQSSKGSSSAPSEEACCKQDQGGNLGEPSKGDEVVCDASPTSSTIAPSAASEKQDCERSEASKADSTEAPDLSLDDSASSAETAAASAEVRAEALLEEVPLAAYQVPAVASTIRLGTQQQDYLTTGRSVAAASASTATAELIAACNLARGIVQKRVHAREAAELAELTQATEAADSSSSTAPAPPATPEAAGGAGQLAVLTPGTEVIIQRLTKCPEFNGLRGTVQCFDEAVGRYDILLPAPVGSTGQRWAKVKRDNLHVAVQPKPPCHSPVLEIDGMSEPLVLPAILPSVDLATLAEVGIISDLHHPPVPFVQDWSWYGGHGFPVWDVPALPLATSS